MSTYESEAISTLSPPVRYCPKHGATTISVQVSGDTEHVGHYCQKCFAENVIVPNCEKLTEADK